VDAEILRAKGAQYMKVNRIIALSAAAAGATTSAALLSAAYGAFSATEVVAGPASLCEISTSQPYAASADDIVQVAHPRSFCV
jgi:hypothetical protein